MCWFPKIRNRNKKVKWWTLWFDRIYNFYSRQADSHNDVNIILEWKLKTPELKQQPLSLKFNIKINNRHPPFHTILSKNNPLIPPSPISIIIYTKYPSNQTHPSTSILLSNNLLLTNVNHAVSSSVKTLDSYNQTTIS